MTQVHLSALVLEEIVTGGRRDTDAASGAHLATCTTCRERLEQLRAETDAYLQRRPPAAFVRRVVADHERRVDRRRRLLWASVVFGTVAACAVALVVIWSRPIQPRNPMIAPTSRLRGTAPVQVLAVQGGKLVPISANAQLPAETQLRFRLHTGPARVCVYHRCGADLTLLYPQGPAITAPTYPWLLPGTFALTATTARDYLVIALLSMPRDCRAITAGVRRRLERSGGRETASGLFRLILAPLPRATSRDTGKQ